MKFKNNSQKRKFNLLRNVSINVQHPYPPWKCKSKLLLDFTLHVSEWPMSIKQMTTHSGKDLE